MYKMLIILLVALTFEAIGVLYLSKGLKQMGEVGPLSTAEVVRVIKVGVTNRNLILGVFFEALFFGGLLTLMSKGDVSFIWPLTSLSFVFTTVAAKYFLNEQVSPARWAGVLLIMAGAALITWTEKTKNKPPVPTTAIVQAEAKGR